MDIVKSSNTELNKEIEYLKTEAMAQLPESIQDVSQARAWVARRMLEIGERGRRLKQTVQALLTTWVVNGEYGKIWMAHPDKPESFREFLQSVGTDAENNKLSPSVITDMVAIAEEIVPFCKHNGLEVNGFVTTDLWTKFREAIPRLRRAVREDSMDDVNIVLADVKALPSRDAMRAKYRKQHNTDDPLCTGDIIRLDGKVAIVLVMEPDKAHLIKSVLARFTRWRTIAVGHFEGNLATIKVNLND